MTRFKTAGAIFLLGIAFAVQGCTSSQDQGQSQTQPTITGDSYFADQEGGDPDFLFTVGTDGNGDPAFLAVVQDGSGDAVWGTRATNTVGFPEWTVTGVTFTPSEGEGPQVGDVFPVLIARNTLLFLFGNTVLDESQGFDGFRMEVFAQGQAPGSCVTDAEAFNMVATLDAETDFSEETGRTAFGQMAYAGTSPGVFDWASLDEFFFFWQDFETGPGTPRHGAESLACDTAGNMTNLAGDSVVRTGGGLEFINFAAGGGFIMLPQAAAAADPLANGKTYLGIDLRPGNPDNPGGGSDGRDVMVPLKATADGSGLALTAYETFSGTELGTGTITLGDSGLAPAGMHDASGVLFEGIRQTKAVFIDAVLANGKILLIGLLGYDDNDNLEFEPGEVETLVLIEQ